MIIIIIIMIITIIIITVIIIQYIYIASFPKGPKRLYRCQVKNYIQKLDYLCKLNYKKKTNGENARTLFWGDLKSFLTCLATPRHSTRSIFGRRNIARIINERFSKIYTLKFQIHSTLPLEFFRELFLSLHV